MLGETAWGVYLASLDPEAEAPTLAGAAGRHQRVLAPDDPQGGGGGGPGTKPWGRGHSSKAWSKVLVTAEAGPSPLHFLHFPSFLHHPWGQFPETGSGPPNQLGTVLGPSGAGKSGDPQVAGVWGGVGPPSSVKASCAV